MANKMKGRKLKAKNRRNQAMINKKEIIPINKSSNGTQMISNKSSSNNKKTLRTNPKVNKPQKLNKSKNLNLRSQLKKQANQPESKSDNKSNFNLTVINNNPNNKIHMVLLTLVVSLSINSPKLKSRPKEEEIPTLRKSLNISPKIKREGQPTNKKINPSPS